MKDKFIRYGFVFGLLVVCIAQIAIYSQATNELSNKLLAWGFRRGENHAQAVLDTESKRVIEQYEGITMGNAESPYIYLTFDCGYEEGYTTSVLDTLQENNVKAVFFITGHYLNSAGDMVKRMIEDGHIVGNQFPTMVMYHLERL